MKLTRRKRQLATLASIALLSAGQAQAVMFVLSSTGDVNADAGFAAAADYIESQFSDTGVVVNITAGFANLGGSTLGQAGSNTVISNYAAFTAAALLDSTSADDALYVAGLPGGATYSKFINRTSDNPNGANSAVPYVHTGVSSVRLTRANAKALGLEVANAAGEDAAITFNNTFTFDFDQSDGITSGQIDFVGVAIHELMHAMGFTSGVDVLDGNPTGFFASAFDTFASSLDFTRHSADSLAAGADMDWTADNRNKLYSLDGGTTTLIANAFSTGVDFGDGRQASHWRDGLGIGIMDPTSAPAGSINVVTANDLQALDVIGWDLAAFAVPEPSSTMLLALSSLGLLIRRRR